MIIRVFRARLKSGAYDAFARITDETTLPVMRVQPGLLTVRAGGPGGTRDVFAILSVWKDLESLKAYTGDNWEEALVLPGEADLVIETSVQHFDESYNSLTTMRHALAGKLRALEAQTVENMRLTDEQWERIHTAIPPPNREGRPRADNRRTLDGILYVLRTGSRWQDLPKVYGSYVTCWRRFQQWEADGTWEAVWRVLFSTLDTQGKLVWARAFLDASLPPLKRGRRRTA